MLFISWSLEWSEPSLRPLEDLDLACTYQDFDGDTMPRYHDLLPDPYQLEHTVALPPSPIGEAAEKDESLVLHLEYAKK